MDNETYLLGACLNDRAVLQEAIDRLIVPCFENPIHQEIFKILKQMFRAEIGISVQMAIKYCEDHDLLKKIGGAKVLVNLGIISDGGIDSTYYINKIHEAYARRVIAGIGKEMLSHQADDIYEYKDALVRRIEDLNQMPIKDFCSTRNIFSSFKDGKDYIQFLDEFLEQAKAGKDSFEGFRTGYKKLDEMIGGFKNGTSTIIGARSSSGKTTFICNMIIKLMGMYPHSPIGFFSLEMPKNSIFEKILYTHAEVSYTKVMNEGTIIPDEYHRLCRATEEMKEWPLFHFDHPGINVSEFKGAIKRAIARHNIKIFFIDYLTKIQGDNRTTNKHQEIDQVSKAIQECAIEHNIPIVTLAQLNRGAVTRPDKRPIMADLRESGSIEEDADTILLMHRPKHYDTSLQNDHTELYVAKNRHFGELGKITLEFKHGKLLELPTIEEIAQGAMISGMEDKQKAWEKRYGN